MQKRRGFRRRGLVIERDIKHMAMPVVAVEDLDRIVCIRFGGKQNGARVDVARIVKHVVHIGAEHGACATEQILQVLPTDLRRQVPHIQLSALIASCMGTSSCAMEHGPRRIQVIATLNLLVGRYRATW